MKNIIVKWLGIDKKADKEIFLKFEVRVFNAFVNSEVALKKIKELEQKYES